MSLKEKRILVVEDNPDDEALTLRALATCGIPNQVHVSNNGEDALNYLREEAHLPHLVLLDLKLPKVCGLDVLKHIRSNTKTAHLPVIILTTSDEQVDLENCYQLHCNSFVRKPVDFSNFRDCIKKLALYWLSLNVIPKQRVHS